MLLTQSVLQNTYYEMKKNHKDSDGFCHRKLTFKVRFCPLKYNNFLRVFFWPKIQLILCPSFGSLGNCHTLQTQIDSKDNIAFDFCVNAIKTWIYVYLPLSMHLANFFAYTLCIVLMMYM